MTKTAVVILNWNGKNHLKQFLPSVVKNTSSPDAEIYVADNGSTDDSINFIKENYPKIKLILLDKNYGFAEGYNKALAQINAKYFVLLNSDVEVTENWLDASVSYLDKNNDCAACMPKLKAYSEKDYFEYAGAGGGFIDKYGYPFCQGRILNVIEKDNGQFDQIKDIFWATGACLFIKADLYKEVGGLDGRFFAHMEEIDLCWRLKNRAYRIAYIPETTVYHLGGGTLPNNSPRKLFLNFRNNLLLLYKNLPENELRWKMFVRKILDGVAGIKFLASFSFRELNAVVKAHIAFYKLLKIYKPIRKEIQSKATKHQHPEIYPKSIIIDFFLKKKKFFKDLYF